VFAACSLRRRYRRRKQTIPWHKMKIDGPMTFCGAMPTSAQQPDDDAGPKDKDA
jgi:hypothetical protein